MTALDFPPVMLLHGLTGMPSMLRPLVRTLETHGIDTHTPVIAGHATSIDELSKTTLSQWIASVEEPFKALTDSRGPIVVGGISLGGLLSLELSLRHPDRVLGAILLSTPLDLPIWLKTTFFCVNSSPARYVYKGQRRSDKGIADPLGRKEFECYDYFPFKSIQNLFALRAQVLRRLDTLRIPVLMIHSIGDKTVPYSSVSVMKRHYTGPSLEIVTLEKSQHVITLDLERAQVARSCLDFIRRLAAAPTPDRRTDDPSAI